jgi:hypothetical protein
MPNNIIKVADKPTLDGVKIITEDIDTKIGDPADLENAGSVMGKLNKVLADASTNMGYVMEGEEVTVTISTASVTVDGSNTKIQRVANFKPTHTGKARVVVDFTTDNTTSTETMQIYVSTTSAANPSQATLESTKKGATEAFNTRYYRSGVIEIETSSLTANSNYYIHVVYTAVGGAAITINDVWCGVSYETSTPCQSIIKSIQRGISTPENNGIVEISPVVPEKSFVILEGDSGGNATAAFLTATKLILVVPTDYNALRVSRTVIWQVIEFY